MTDENENIETPDTLTEAEAQKRSSSILGKLRKVVNKHTVAIVAVGALATEKADAQGEFHFSESSGKLTYTEASVPQSASRQASGPTITYQQAAVSQNCQAVFNSLPPYAQQRVTELGMQNQIITRYNTATGLNRPEDGIIYACAIPDPNNSNNVIFIPVAEALYRAGARNPTPIRTITVPRQDADILMTHPNEPLSPRTHGTTKVYNRDFGPMTARVRYMDTLENRTRNLRVINQQQDEASRQQTKAATGPLRRATQKARDWNRQIEETNRTIKRTQKNVDRTIGTISGIFGGGRRR